LNPQNSGADWEGRHRCPAYTAPIPEFYSGFWFVKNIGRRAYDSRALVKRLGRLLLPHLLPVAQTPLCQRSSFVLPQTRLFDGFMRYFQVGNKPPRFSEYTLKRGCLVPDINIIGCILFLSRCILKYFKEI